MLIQVLDEDGTALADFFADIGVEGWSLANFEFCCGWSGFKNDVPSRNKGADEVLRGFDAENILK